METLNSFYRSEEVILHINRAALEHGCKLLLLKAGLLAWMIENKGALSTRMQMHDTRLPMECFGV